jgi:hypothetical protein
VPEDSAVVTFRRAVTNTTSNRWTNPAKRSTRLKPVNFRYNKEYDATQTLAFGLIAEEVAAVYPDLVGRNAAGQPESVRYEQINAMLLNEFLKEHRKVEKLESALEALNERLKEQEAKIDKVSAHLELSKAALQVVGSKP